MANTKAIVVVSLSVLAMGGVVVYLLIQHKNKKDAAAKAAAADAAAADAAAAKAAAAKAKTDTTTNTNKDSGNQTKTIPSTAKNQFFRVGDLINPTIDLGEQPVRVKTANGWQIATNNDGSTKTTSISPSDMLKIIDFIPYNGINYVVAETMWNRYPVAIQYFYAKLAAPNQ